MALNFSDPTSFKIPALGSGFIILVLMVLLTSQWIGQEDRVVKTPQHIAARIVQINKPKPKVAPVKKTVTKAPPQKAKPKPKPKPKPKAKPIPKKVQKPEVAKETAKPVEPLPLPGLDFMDALEQEEAQTAKAEAKKQEQAAKRAEYEQEQQASYISQIQALIEASWRLPPSTKHSDEVVLRIYLVPTGEVTEVVLLESSGNDALDRSAEQAVWRVGVLPVPDDLVLFEKSFRQFIFTLKPENARL